MALRVGDTAPDFTVTTHDGKELSLAKVRGQKNIVLYFYPRDFTSVCTKEACGFRDMVGELENSDTMVIGVSPDSNETHRDFAKKHNVTFALIADEEMNLAATYQLFTGVVGKLSKLVRKFPRVTYVIGKDGKVAAVFDSEILAGVHIDGVRDIVRGLANSS